MRGESDVALIAEVSSSIFLANLVGLPAISVPVSHARAEGAAAPLPVGLQLIGAPWSEGALLRLAQAVERDVPAGSRPRPPSFFVDGSRARERGVSWGGRVLAAPSCP